MFRNNILRICTGIAKYSTLLKLMRLAKDIFSPTEFWIESQLNVHQLFMLPLDAELIEELTELTNEDINLLFLSNGLSTI